MAEWNNLVKVATITEEDVEEEEIGEDGMVAIITNPNAATRENGIDSDTSCDSKRNSVIEREDSMVEYDGEADNPAAKNISLLQSITFESDPIPIPHARDSQTLPSRLPSSRSSSSPCRASSSRSSPSRTSPTPPSPSSPQSVRRKFTQRRGKRGPGFTMVLSDKFVTELTLHDPGSWSASDNGANASQVCLGLFLATDMITGDHTVYKVSPVSPLAVLKLKPQDRVMRVNGLSVVGWSHNCILEWIRNLSLLEDSQHSDSPREISLCVEYRRAGKSVRAAWESPSVRQVLATIAMSKKRATVRSVKETDMRMEYRDTHTCKLRLAVPSQPHRYLASRVLPGGGVGVGISEEEEETEDPGVQFLLHTFYVHPSLVEGGDREGGKVVVVEATSPSSWFLLPSSLTRLTFMQCSWSAMEGLTQQDARCFVLHHTSDNSTVRMEAVFTGNFVSVDEDRVMLVVRKSCTSDLPDSTLFNIIYQ